MKNNLTSDLENSLTALKVFIKNSFEENFCQTAKSLSNDPLEFFSFGEKVKSFNQRYSTLIELKLNNKYYGLSYSISYERNGYLIQFYFQDNININGISNSIYFEFPLLSFTLKHEDSIIDIKKYLNFDNDEEYFNTSKINELVINFILIKNEFCKKLSLNCIEKTQYFDSNFTEMIKIKAYQNFLAKFKSLIS